MYTWLFITFGQFYYNINLIHNCVKTENAFCLHVKFFRKLRISEFKMNDANGFNEEISLYFIYWHSTGHNTIINIKNEDVSSF